MSNRTQQKVDEDKRKLEQAILMS